jgi:hypothetical protein
MASHASSNDEHGDVAGLIGGTGILLMQAAAVIPGLLPVLFLLLPVVLPLVVLGIAGGVLVGIPLGLWRLGISVVRSLRRKSTGSESAQADLVATGAEIPVG